MRSTPRDLLWNLTLAGLGLCVAAVLWFPIFRIGSTTSENYNEGWNAYRQSMAASGQPLYGAAPGLFTTNYPPLSFHLVGLFGNVLFAGRAISLVSLGALGALVCGVVRGAGGTWRGGIFAGLCLVLWICTLTPDRRAMNDPELLAAALAMLGIFAFVWAKVDWRWLVLSAFAFTLAMFTKLDVVALPLSVAVVLLHERNFIALAVWVGAGAVCAAMFLALTIHIDGPYFVSDMIQPRGYLPQIMHANGLYFFKRFGLVLAICVGYFVSGRERAFCAVLLVISVPFAVYFCGGDGVDFNVFYTPMLAMAILSGLAVSAAERNPPLFALALALPALAGAWWVPRQLHRDFVSLQELPELSAATQRAVALVGAAKGPVICEDILICYAAAKKLDYDPFYVNDQVATGRLREPDVIALLAEKHYVVIEIDPTVETPGLRHKRFSAAELRSIAASYKQVFRDGEIELLEPKP